MKEEKKMKEGKKMKEELEELMKLLPKSSKLIFEGRKSAKLSEVVCLCLPVEFLQKFDSAMLVVVFGATLSNHWGSCYNGTEKMRFVSIHFTSATYTGGSIVSQVITRLTSEMQNVNTMLQELISYEPMTFISK